MGSPGARPGMRRSGTLPAFPAVEEKGASKEVDLPVRPSVVAFGVAADTSGSSSIRNSGRVSQGECRRCTC